MDIGILGGTGPAGRGLAVRFARAGHTVVIGGRDGERAQGVADELIGANPGLTLDICGTDNAGAANATIVIVATPWDSALATIAPLKDALRSKIVISMANALTKVGREMVALYPTRGSVAAMVAAALPDSLVGASFHHLPAGEMENLSSGLQSDVLVCSDHVVVRDTTVELINSVEGLRGLDAGSLAQAAPIESFTAVCITLNIRYKAHSTLKMAGIDH